MNGALWSGGRVGCFPIRAVIVVALILAGQFLALSHSFGHESEKSDCVVCRISKPHKQATASLITAGLAVPAGLEEAACAQIPPCLKPITYDTQRKRAPPIPS